MTNSPTPTPGASHAPFSPTSQPHSPRTFTRRSLAPLALAPLFLGACQSGTSSATGNASADPAGPTQAASPGAVDASATHSADGPGAATNAPTDQAGPNANSAFAWGAGAAGQPASTDAQLLITDVRVGTHPEKGYDRVVVEFSGPGNPGWLAPQWVQEAYTPGKGDPIEVSGNYRLALIGTGALGSPTEEQLAQMYQGPKNLDVNGQAISQVHIDLPFESEFQVVVGANTQNYRVLALQSPTRLVIDVANEG